MKRQAFITVVTMMIVVLFALPAFANQRVGIRVVDAEVRDVLTALASAAGVGLVADDTVSGKITIQFDDLPFFTALDIVTKAKGLDYQRIDNVVVVGSREHISRQFGELHIFKLQYAQAAQVADILTAALQSTRSVSASDAAGRLTVDTAANILIFAGRPDEAAVIARIMENVDVPYQQVSLEAHVLAIDHQAAKQLGVEWQWSAGPNYPEYTKGDDHTWTVKRPPADGGSALTSGGHVPGIIQFGRTPEGFSYELYYQFKINALVTDGKASILARPKIMTIDGQEAVINIGGEVPVPVTTTSNTTTTTSIEYKEAGIILKYTPRINNDGYITATVHTEVSSPVYVADLKAYRFNKRSASTQVRLQDGQTMVIGGLIGKDEVKTINKLPFLGDLPLIGSFFRSTNNSHNESEVIIFLTAHIVK